MMDSYIKTFALQFNSLSTLRNLTGSLERLQAFSRRSDMTGYLRHIHNTILPMLLSYFMARVQIRFMLTNNIMDWANIFFILGQVR